MGHKKLQSVLFIKINVRPLDEKEKNYEIKSFTSTDNILYYATL